MKKILFVFLFMTCCLLANAQCKCKCDSLTYYYISVKYNVKGNAVFGDPFKKGDYYVQNKNGQDEVFDTAIHLINFFSDKGWEYVESSKSQSIPTFTLRKKTKNKNTLLDNLKLRKNFSL